MYSTHSLRDRLFGRGGHQWSSFELRKNTSPTWEKPKHRVAVNRKRDAAEKQGAEVVLSGRKTGKQVRSVTPIEGAQVKSNAAQTCVLGVKCPGAVFQICRTRKCGRENQGTAILNAQRREALGR